MTPHTHCPLGQDGHDGTTDHAKFAWPRDGTPTSGIVCPKHRPQAWAATVVQYTEDGMAVLAIDRLELTPGHYRAIIPPILASVPLESLGP